MRDLMAYTAAIALAMFALLSTDAGRTVLAYLWGHAG